VILPPLSTEVDDEHGGSGQGMLMKPEPIFAAVESC